MQLTGVVFRPALGSFVFPHNRCLSCIIYNGLCHSCIAIVIYCPCSVPCWPMMIYHVLVEDYIAVIELILSWTVYSY